MKWMLSLTIIPMCIRCLFASLVIGERCLYVINDLPSLVIVTRDARGNLWSATLTRGNGLEWQGELFEP